MLRDDFDRWPFLQATFDIKPIYIWAGFADPS